MARSEVASDTFDASIDANWNNGDGDWAVAAWVAGGFVEPGAINTDCSIRWNADTPNDAQYSQIIVQTHGSSNALLGPICRAAAGADESCYIGTINAVSSNKYNIYEVTAAFGFTNIAGAGTPAAVASGTLVTLEAEDDALRLYTDEGGTDTLRVETTDATIASGSWAIYFYDQTNVAECRITAWAGGNLTSGLPEILTQPQDLAVVFGNSATFSVEATSFAGESLSYQWTENGSNVGSNASSYTTTQTFAADQNARFAVSVWDTQGTTQSINAYLRLTIGSGYYVQETVSSDRYTMEDGGGFYLIEPWGGAAAANNLGPFFIGPLDGMGTSGFFFKNRLH